tara:strand:+ start:2308 stop:2676 length:369 start_codon:yes stop_codon:yes gene_type:complete
MASIILVVDDSKSSRNELRSILSADKYDVVECENGLNGLEAYRSLPRVDLIVVDVNMPVMGGLEMIKSIRSMGRAPVPVIVICSICSESLKSQAKDLGVTAWVVKPFDREIFLRGVNTLIGV